jgi:hypothetical protein
MIPSVAFWATKIHDEDPKALPERNEMTTGIDSKRSSAQGLGDDQTLRCSILGSVPVAHGQSGKEPFRYILDNMRIAWTFTSLPDQTGKDEWICLDYFSTLETGSIPKCPMAFFGDLLQEIRNSWISLCDSIDIHISSCVSTTPAVNSSLE